MNKSMIILLGATVGGALTGAPARAATFDTGLGDIQAEWVSNITGGLGVRTKNPSCSLIGDPGAYGCGSAANRAQKGNASNGDLNYKKGQAFAGYTSFTSELLLTMPSTNSKFLVRATGMVDFAADRTQRTPLAPDARKQVVHSMQLLDFWAQKGFTVGDQRAHMRLGNQVINWGESLFAAGGINATNAVDIQKLLIPGTQLKQVLLPAPMLSFASSLPAGFSTEAYYQFQWNGNKYPPVGSYWSPVNIFGRGAQPASISTQNFNVAGSDAATIAGAGSKNSQIMAGVNQNLLSGVYAGAPFHSIGVPFGTVLPGHRPQFGIKVGYKPESADINFGFYYQNYTDKAPVLSYLGSGGAQWSYLQSRTLLGASANFGLGDWAIGAELSYRPRDAVAMSGCYLAGGPPDANTNLLGGATCQAWKDMKKIQLGANAMLLMTPTSHPFLKLLGADNSMFMAELTMIKYPGVDPDRQYRSTANGKQVYQLVDAGYAPWLNNHSGSGYPIASGQGTSTSVGATVDFSVTYDSTLIEGWSVTPGMTFSGGLKGYTPTFSANYKSGVKSTNVYMLFNQNPQVWQAGINYTAFYGGNAVSQSYADRNFIGAFVTRNF